LAAVVASASAAGLVLAQTPSASTPAPASAQPARAPLVEPRPLTEITIPTDRSDKPKRAEWAAAPRVDVPLRSPRAKSCTAQVIREYVRVRCPFVMAGVRQFAGSIEDVETFVTPKGERDVFSGPNGADVVFPLRKEQGFVFQFFEIAEGYDGWGVGLSVLVDVSWAASDPAPTVVLR